MSNFTSLPLSNYRGVRRLYNGFAALSLMTRLRLMNHPENPAQVADLALNSPLIGPAQVPSELRQFAKIISERRPKAVLEIGTFRGGTLMVLCKLSDPGATVISVDLPGGSFGGGYKWFRVPLLKAFTARRQRLHLLRKDSHQDDTLAQVKAILGDQGLDLLFIDGDHTYEGVRADFNLYSPLVRAGGIVAFHDIAEHQPSSGCEVARFWKEIKGSHRYSEVIENPSQGWAGIGLLYL
jgi:predicted O-methyltransferase YrrM